MKKILIVLLVLIISLVAASSVMAEEDIVSDLAYSNENKETIKGVLEYTVTFETGYGNNTKTFTQKVEEGMYVIKPKDPKIDNGIFIGWYDEKGDKFNFYTKIEEDTFIHAKYIINSGPIPLGQATIIFNSSGGSKVEQLEVYKGETMPIVKSPNREGYRFLGWFTEEGVKWDFKSKVYEGMTLYAHWEKIPQSGTVVKDYSPKTGDCNYIGITALLSFLSLSIIVLNIRFKRDN